MFISSAVKSYGTNFMLEYPTTRLSGSMITTRESVGTRLNSDHGALFTQKSLSKEQTHLAENSS